MIIPWQQMKCLYLPVNSVHQPIPVVRGIGQVPGAVQNGDNPGSPFPQSDLGPPQWPVAGRWEQQRQRTIIVILILLSCSPEQAVPFSYLKGCLFRYRRFLRELETTRQALTGRIVKHFPPRLAPLPQPCPVHHYFPPLNRTVLHQITQKFKLHK